MNCYPSFFLLARSPISPISLVLLSWEPIFCAAKAYRKRTQLNDGYCILALVITFALQLILISETIRRHLLIHFTHMECVQHCSMCDPLHLVLRKIHVESMLLHDMASTTEASRKNNEKCHPTCFNKLWWHQREKSESKRHKLTNIESSECIFLCEEWNEKEKKTVRN